MSPMRPTSASARPTACRRRSWRRASHASASASTSNRLSRKCGVACAAPHFCTATDRETKKKPRRTQRPQRSGSDTYYWDHTGRGNEEEETTENAKAAKKRHLLVGSHWPGNKEKTAANAKSTAKRQRTY